MSEAPKLKVGDLIWKRERWVAGGAPWRQVEITGETSRSWIVAVTNWKSEKVPKRGEHSGYAFSDEELEAARYVDSRYAISGVVRNLPENPEAVEGVAKAIGYRFRASEVADAVSSVQNGALLKQVAELIGWRAPWKAEDSEK